MAENIDSPEFWSLENNCSSGSSLNNYSMCNVCRLCASISDNVVPIFDQVNEKGNIYTKLKKCLPSITVLENDMKPKQICLSCLSRLDLCASFIDMSREADCKFEILLQNKTIPQTILSESLSNSRTFSDNEEASSGSKNQVNFPNKESLDQLYQQQRSFSQQLLNTPISVSTTQNFPSSNAQVDVNRSILQNLLTQDTVSSQDVVVLVEVKCKDLVTASNTTVITKKTDLPHHVIVPSLKIETNEMKNNVSQQTKIMDTSGHIRVINLSDFDGKFNQFDKIVSSFITTDDVSLEKSLCTSSGIVPFSKNFESDVLNMLKLENLGSDDLVPSSVDVLKSASTTSTAISSMLSTTVKDDTKQNNTIREFHCEVCGKQFTRRNRLNAHVARHSSVRPHSCDKCDRRFITRWDLTLHSRIHSGIFSCEFCGKAFPAKGKLERHRRTHTGERPFPCTLCNRAFSEKRNLKNHLRTHLSPTADSREKSNDGRSLRTCLQLSTNSDDALKGTCNMYQNQDNTNEIKNELVD